LGKTKTERRQQICFGRSFQRNTKYCKSFRIQEKVKGIGFDFATAEDAWEKVDEELAEFHAETDLEKKNKNWEMFYFR
jgi:uncharacterized protein YabN with tetrapyrrole methylase and pyrophosphatase domain